MIDTLIDQATDLTKTILKVVFYPDWDEQDNSERPEDFEDDPEQKRPF